MGADGAMTLWQKHAEYIGRAAEVAAARCVRASGRVDLFEDFRQDILVAVAEALPAYDPDGRATTRTYVSRVIRNTSVDLMRRAAVTARHVVSLDAMLEDRP